MQPKILDQGHCQETMDILVHFCFLHLHHNQHNLHTLTLRQVQGIQGRPEIRKQRQQHCWGHSQPNCDQHHELDCHAAQKNAHRSMQCKLCSAKPRAAIPWIPRRLEADQTVTQLKMKATMDRSLLQKTQSKPQPLPPLPLPSKQLPQQQLLSLPQLAKEQL
jgi:hypothetical protein